MQIGDGLRTIIVEPLKSPVELPPDQPEPLVPESQLEAEPATT